MSYTPFPMEEGKLTHGPVAQRLREMAVPMFFGIATIILFSVVDTYFVGQIGEHELAAMGFCFPVAFFVQNIAMGIGTGATAVISQAIGAGDHERVRRLTTHALILGVILVVLVAATGLMTLDPLFSLMGAKPETLPLIREYMVPWFAGVGLLVIPMVGNSALRATGDTKTPATIMMVAGFVNVVLDPLLIFGIGPFPRWELFGAAIATCASWTVAFFGAFFFLHVRNGMLTNPLCGGVTESFVSILKVGMPATGTNVMVPLSTGVLTSMVAEYGQDAVGAYGVAGRLEALSMIGIFAVAASIGPFVGQNYGALNCERIRKSLKLTMGFSLFWGFGTACILAIFAVPIASLFSESQEVIDNLTPYLGLVPWGYGLLGMALMVTNTFNASDRPLRATLVIGVRLFVLAIPLAKLGSKLAGLQGLYAGILVANVITGLFALALVWKFIDSIDSESGQEDCSAN
jgi:putative MATE family efflux protein